MSDGVLKGDEEEEEDVADGADEYQRCGWGGYSVHSSLVVNSVERFNKIYECRQN